MSFFTSPLFVILFMSSPVWLGILAYLTRDFKRVSYTFWSYTTLTFLLDATLLVLAEQQVFWAALFSLNGLILFICSIVAAFIVFRWSDDTLESWEYVGAFLFLTGIFFAFMMTIPGWILELARHVIATYHNVIQLP